MHSKKLPHPEKTEDLLAEHIVGNSAWAQQVRTLIRRVARRPTSILISGPSGTGKELIARSIHAHSPRADRRFVSVDCASVAGSLFASQMFGHVKGAFTGAAQASLGCFRAADGGVVFLDEIGELDAELQAKLLRVLQQRTVVPVGSHDEVPVDVRVIAATNRNLAHEVETGRFRMDLFYRLNVIAIDALPLKDRLEDIEVLANHFLAEFAAEDDDLAKQLSLATIQAMKQHDWPGNVRELRNVMERAVVFTEGRVIGPAAIPRAGDALSPREKSASNSHPSQNMLSFPKEDRQPTMLETELERIQEALESANYNQSVAASLLGLTRQQLRRRIKKYLPNLLPAKRGRPREDLGSLRVG